MREMNELKKNGRRIKGREWGERKKQKRERTRSVDSELFPASIFSSLLPLRLLNSIFFIPVPVSTQSLLLFHHPPYQPPPLFSLHTRAGTQGTNREAFLPTIFRLGLYFTHPSFPTLYTWYTPADGERIYGESRALFNWEASLSLSLSWPDPSSLGLFFQAAAAALLHASKKSGVALVG